MAPIEAAEDVGWEKGVIAEHQSHVKG